ITDGLLTGFFLQGNNINRGNKEITTMSSYINLSYIKEMLGDDPEVVKEFVSEIIMQIKETELLIHNFVEEKNFSAISSAAHKIKSVVQMIGADHLYQKIQELELTAKTSDNLEQINAL